MIIAFSIAIVLIVLIIMAYLWCIKPGKINEDIKTKIEPFTKTYIAHRGLFDKKLGIPENSIPAFKRAVQNGYGIELDVRLTKDGKMVVFHDPNIKRMCGSDVRVCDLTFEELEKYRLDETDCQIPLFSEVLKVIDGKVPVIIEIKSEKDSEPTAPVLNKKLEGYKGNYCIESFDPLQIKWYRFNRPDVVRGILVNQYKYRKKGKVKSEYKHKHLIKLNLLMFNFISRPDFIAHDYKMTNTFTLRLMRKIFRFYSAAWTIKNQETMDEFSDIMDIFIFDSFIPESKSER